MKDPNQIFSNIESEEIERLKLELAKEIANSDRLFTSARVAKLHNKKLMEENAKLSMQNNELTQKVESLMVKIDPLVSAILQKDPMIKQLRLELNKAKSEIKRLSNNNYKIHTNINGK